MIRVLVVDDQDLVREGFAVMLSLCDDIEVVGQASDGSEALAVAIHERPDVVLMDIRMPVMDGLEATRRLGADSRTASCKVVILTTFDLDEYVFEALRLGASGFLLKDTRRDQLIDAIRVVAAGEALLSPRITRTIIEEFTSRPSIRHRQGEAARNDHRARARCAALGGSWRIERGDRRSTVHGRRHREDAREPPAHQTRCERPSTTGGVRLRVGLHTRRPGRVAAATPPAGRLRGA